MPHRLPNAEFDRLDHSIGFIFLAEGQAWSATPWTRAREALNM
ncbi:MAG: hypothetical protein AAF517_24510 [Planctomycetota bacterium]